MGLGVDLGISLIFGLIGFLFGILVGGLVLYGGAAVIKHYLLRLLPRFHCGASWDSADALDQAVSHILMTRVGGSYRFYHRLLQEHLAEHEDSDLPVATILGPQDD
ncbi:hypothetical protein [Candidatus Chloroploca asiatica]|uniref:Uncharacterized protein n=1 Tax=Candidatus Chloroploca asiatica TaxID=1506545 RepID=A0A2H3L4J9_9CHLR|nr:hypothetical protein [Candidatus Chloroploca asiatica]PDV97170.1 hypothetical protein A9Q02_04480 [Candidatus Chloroploca asiatica]